MPYCQDSANLGLPYRVPPAPASKKIPAFTSPVADQTCNCAVPPQLPGLRLCSCKTLGCGGCGAQPGQQGSNCRALGPGGCGALLGARVQSVMGTPSCDGASSHLLHMQIKIGLKLALKFLHVFKL